MAWDPVKRAEAERRALPCRIKALTKRGKLRREAVSRQTVASDVEAPLRDQRHLGTVLQDAGNNAFVFFGVQRAEIALAGKTVRKDLPCGVYHRAPGGQHLNL